MNSYLGRMIFEPGREMRNMLIVKRKGYYVTQRGGAYMVLAHTPLHSKNLLN
jgi:hypothetical protein